MERPPTSRNLRSVCGWFDATDVPTGCCSSKIKLPGLVFRCRVERVIHMSQAARSAIHRFPRTRRKRAPSQHTADMDPHRLGQTTVVVAIADPELLDQVLSVTAVVGLEPLVLSDPDLLRPHWTSASVLLLDIDQAARVAAMGLPRRAEVYLITGDKSSGAQAQQWSIRLGAASIPLPASAGWLSEALADVSGTGRSGGHLICVVGGSGGVGASTLATGLAFVAARASQRTMLIDADSRSGGLDLLLGAERTAGWRWPRLATARGHLGDLTGQLPTVEGVALLSMARGESARGWELQAEQMKSVLLSALRSHEITVVDLPRTLGAAAGEALRRAHLVVLLVRNDVRGVAAGQEVVRELEGESDSLGLVVRQGRSRLLEPNLVASGVGLPLLGSFADDPALVVAAERGDPPARAARSSLARLCRQLLSDLLASQPANEKELARA
jgi:secretion/DNA translocation related CpaE-like protein